LYLVQGSGIRDEGPRFRDYASGFMFQCSKFSRFRDEELGFRVQGSGLMVLGVGLGMV
jgi:hypothetical protein